MKRSINVKLDMDELDLTAAESKATYEEIKSYVAEHYDGMKTSLDKGTQRKTTENELPSLTQCTA